MLTMQSTLAVLEMAAVYAPAQAQTTTYTTSAAFLATLQPGAYTETFLVAAANGVYTSGAFIGSNAYGDTVTITFGAGITAAGGNFFITILTDAFVAGAVAPIPEASTWAMMALGLAGLLAVARRRQA